MDPEEFEEKAYKEEKKKKKPKMKISGKSVFLLAEQAEKIKKSLDPLDKIRASKVQDKKKK